MKTLIRNKIEFYYALFEEKIPKVDEYGNNTGEYEVRWQKPLKYLANISAAKGETSTRQFGESENYDRVIVMSNDSPKIDEYTVLWVDTVPKLDSNGLLLLNEDGSVVTPHDHIVKKVARSINSVSIAISRVNVSG
nr:MAG TPA: hypothetical protein [Caudoviricetes sp.]